MQLKEGVPAGRWRWAHRRRTRSSWVQEWRESARICWRRGRRCRIADRLEEKGLEPRDWRRSGRSSSASPPRIPGAVGLPPSLSEFAPSSETSRRELEVRRSPVQLPPIPPVRPSFLPTRLAKSPCSTRLAMTPDAIGMGGLALGTPRIDFRLDDLAMP